MKRIFLLITSVLIIYVLDAQAPQKLSYQAVIRNTLNELVAGQVVGMRITILRTSEAGTVVYKETHTPTTNFNGLVTIEIGGGTPVSGNFTNINWANGPYFIKTETDPAGGTNYIISGTSQLLSVPYSLYAKTAGNIPSGTATGDILYWNGTAWTILPKGNEGQVLTTNSSNIPEWQNASVVALLPPAVTTTAATNIHHFDATVNGIVNPNGLMTEVRFEYGLTTDYGDHEWVEDEFYGNTDLIMSLKIPSYSGYLEPSTTYHYRLVANNPVNVSYGDDMTFTTAATSVTVGQSYQGGKVAYILHPNDPGYIEGETHGLIAAPSDQSTGIKWYNGSYITTTAYGNEIGTGNANTIAIVNAQGAGSYAARLCYDLDLGGYNNWYLPSDEELSKILSNKAAIGGFVDDYYWSSTENSDTNAWASDSENSGWAAGKEETLRVRAVHSF